MCTRACVRAHVFYKCLYVYELCMCRYAMFMYVRVCVSMACVAPNLSVSHIYELAVCVSDLCVSMCLNNMFVCLYVGVVLCYLGLSLLSEP